MSSRWKANMGVRVEGGELWGDYYTGFVSPFSSVFAGYVKLRLGGASCTVICLFRAYSFSSEVYHCFICTRDTLLSKPIAWAFRRSHVLFRRGPLPYKEQIHYHIDMVKQETLLPFPLRRAQPVGSSGPPAGPAVSPAPASPDFSSCLRACPPRSQQGSGGPDTGWL